MWGHVKFTTKHNSIVMLSLITMFIFLHVPTINLTFVSFEYAFWMVADHWLNPGKYSDAMGHYFHVQANPLGTSILTYLLFKITHLPIYIWTVRILSILSGALMIITTPSIFKFFAKSDKQKSYLGATLIAINPLIWMLSGRMTADLLPVGLLFLAVVFLVKMPTNWASVLLTTLTFSCAVITKFHSAFLGLIFLFILIKKTEYKINSKLLKKCLFLAIFSSASLLTYLLIIKSNYGFFVIPESQKSLLKLNIFGFFRTLFEYGFFTSVLLGPLSLFTVFNFYKVTNRKSFVIQLFAALIISTIFTLLPSQAGEMDFSFLSEFLALPIIKIIQVSGFTLFILLFLDISKKCFKKKNELSRFVALAVFPLMLVLSFSRPAQRYLIFIIPFLIIFIVNQYIRKDFISKVLLSINTIFCITVILLFSSYHNAQSYSVNNMQNWIVKNGYLKTTHPGDLRPFFTHLYINDIDVNPKNHFVTNDPGDQKVIHKEPVSLFGSFKIRTFYLIELRKPMKYIAR